jgi:hypothetical protein
MKAASFVNKGSRQEKGFQGSRPFFTIPLNKKCRSSELCNEVIRRFFYKTF